MNANKGYYVDMNGKILHTEIVQETIVPWVYFLNDKARACTLYHNVYFETHGLIPQYCMEKCWKVCIIPKDVKQLFEIHDILETLDVPGKCGLDVRPITPQRYLAVMYAESMEEGLVNKQIALDNLGKIVNEEIDDENIFLKRGCTEFENAVPSNLWQMTDLQLEKENEIRDMVDHTWINDAIQPDWVKQGIMRGWTQYAFQTGDLSYKDTPFANDIQKSRKPVTY
jgi:hypothetical protein